MDTLEAIFSRRTIKNFKADPVPDIAIEHALTAGLWAQNHRLTQPWRFTVLGLQTHDALAALAAEAQVDSSPVPADAAARDKAAAAAKHKILSKPAIVAVSYRLAGDPAQRTEDYAATCCAIQNIQLAAWAEGLGMQWSTGKLIRHPRIYPLLQINAGEEEIVGLLYFGYPAHVPELAPRKPLAEVMKRLG